MIEPDFVTVLVALDGNDRGRMFRLHRAQVTVIGRGRNSNVRLRDPSASRMHAQLIYMERQWLVEDLDSAHGTWINERPVKAAPLNFGDSVRIGATNFVLRQKPRESEPASAVA